MAVQHGENGCTMQKVINDKDRIPASEIEYRSSLAKLKQLELNNAKEELNLEERRHNICRIDSALEAFDAFLVDFVEMLVSIPDKVQATIPECKPDQYAEIQQFIDSQLQMLSQKRLYLAIESTAEAQALATAAKEESQKKNQKLKKGKGKK